MPSTQSSSALKRPTGRPPPRRVEAQPKARRYQCLLQPPALSPFPAGCFTGRLLSFVVVAQLLSSAWFRATHHTYAVAEIVAGYGYPESAIVLIVIAEC